VKESSDDSESGPEHSMNNDNCNLPTLKLPDSSDESFESKNTNTTHGEVAIEAGDSDLRSLISAGLKSIGPKCIRLDPETTIDLQEFHELQSNEVAKIMHASLDKRPLIQFIDSESNTSMNMHTGDDNFVLTQIPERIKERTLACSKFEVSKSVVIAKFTRKPYVRYASVRAPQVVERLTAQLDRSLQAAFLRQKLALDCLRHTQRVISLLAESLFLKLESNTLDTLTKRLGQAHRSSETTTIINSDTSSSESKNTTLSKSSDLTTTTSTASSDHGNDDSDRRGSCAATGCKMKLRQLLRHDEGILGRILLEFDEHEVIIRITEKEDFPLFHSNPSIPGNVPVSHTANNRSQEASRSGPSPYQMKVREIVGEERRWLQRQLNEVYAKEISESLEKLVQILIDRFEFPSAANSSSTAGYFGGLLFGSSGDYASYDSDATQAILRDFEHSHAVQSVSGKEEPGFRAPYKEPVLLKEAVDRYRHKLRYALQERVRSHNGRLLTRVVGMFRC